MKEKQKKKTLIIVTLILVAIMSFLVVNRYIYGSFNPFATPVRVVYQGCHYNHRAINTVNLKEKPVIEISRIIDRITGKRFYSTSQDFVGPGKHIYLHINGDEYISYSSGGGG